MINSLIYHGKIRHRRFTPKAHQFSYKLFMFCFDVGAIDHTFKNIPQVSIEKINWFSFKRKNYLKDEKTTLEETARQLVKEKYGSYPTGKIYLLTHLSCLNYCFNPISLYFVFKESSDELDYLIIAVTNTPWNETHLYVLSNAEKPMASIYKYCFKKELHVSPFMGMEHEYRFNLKLNHQKIIVHMESYRQAQLHFDATLSLSAISLAKTSYAKIFFHYPLMTYQITAAIYWQAFKLWFKGIPFHRHPSKPRD